MRPTRRASPALGSGTAIRTGNATLLDSLRGTVEKLAGKATLEISAGESGFSEKVLDAVRADNWLHLHGEVRSAQGREIKAKVRDAFYGDKDDWKGMISEQAIAAERNALRGLAG